MNGKQRYWLVALAGLALGLLLMPSDAWAFAQTDEPPGDAALGEPPPPEGPPQRGGRRGWGGRGPAGDRMREVRDALDKWRSMSDEERAEVREFLSEHYPDRYDMMLELEEKDPERFIGRMARVLPEILRMKELSETDPDQFEARLVEQKAEMELRRLVRRYRAATEEEEKQKLAKQIRPLVEKHFDARQRRLADEVEKLERRVTELRRQIEKQERDRAAEVDRMYERILQGGPRAFDRPGRGSRDGRGEFRRQRGRGPNRGGVPDDADILGPPDDPE